MLAVTQKNDTFMPAALPDVCAPRTAFLEELRSASERRMAYIAAPAGAGKTVSTLLWLRSADRRAVWLGLDAYDNSPSVFYRLLSSALLSLQPKNHVMEEILQDPDFSASPIDHTIRLISAFVPEETGCVLVLDDMHHITQEELLKSLPFVLCYLPENVFILILSRAEAPDVVKTYVQEGFATLFGMEQLSFSTEEIRRYFASLGHFLSMEEAERIFASTNGWAIGVCALAQSGQLNIPAEGNLLLDQYIRTQIWEHWPSDLREFMLKTAITDEMTTELCIRLTGRKDSSALLEQLLHSNSFVSRSGIDLYRYHSLFLDFLRHEIHHTGMDTAPLYKEAFHYFVEQEEHFAARRYAIKSGDLDILTQSLYLFTQYTNPSLDEYIHFSRVFNADALPESICDKLPCLYTVHVWFCYLCGDAKGMEYYLDKLMHFLPVIAEKYPRLLEMTILEFSLDHRTPFSRQIEQFSLLPPITHLHTTQQGASITVQLPFLHRSNRDYWELTDPLLLEKLIPTFGRLLKDQRDMILTGLRSGLLLEQNHLKEAMEAALLAEELMTENTSAELRFSVFSHIAAIHFASGQEEEGYARLDQIAAYLRKNGHAYLIPNLSALRTKYQLLDGNKDAAKTWLGHYFVTETETPELYKIFRHFTTARAWAVLGETHKAIDNLVRLQKLAADFVRPLDMAEAGVLKAALEWATGDRRQAQATLTEALTILQPCRFIRVVADEGAAILPVVKRIATIVSRESYTGALDTSYINEVHIATYEQAKRCRGITAELPPAQVKLSRQQKHMLTLLSQGYKNAQIAALTGLKMPTIKTHLFLAYQKLGVSNAMDAVLKAKDLGILD